MSKINSHLMDWVTEASELGYDMDRLPRMRDMDWILKEQIPASLYFGYSNYPDAKYEFLKLTGGLNNEH
tara:strand:+ start:280 stop:486 length:207 start_codon:yes stop_codon:yes gene_type:complete